MFPLMEVTDKIILPLNQLILVLITRDDVIHSFALPALGVKADANPGRLNSVRFNCFIPRVIIGQCSELCGSLHRNITIHFEATSFASFLNWINIYTD